MVSVRVRLEKRGKVVEEMDLSDGDGVCMGFHGWKEGDFGDALAEP